MTRRSSSITIREVAKQAGVSVATVSRYINRNAPVSDKVSNRLEQVMTELKYAPHAAARNLASRKTRVIGLMLTNIHNDFYVPLLNGVESVIRQRDYNLLVATYQSDTRGNKRPPIGAHNTDGLVVYADSLSDDEMVALHASGFPMVLIHRTPPASLPIPCVTIENKAATFKLVEHLIVHHQKRRILFMRGRAHQEDSYWREMGYKSALESHGIPFDPRLAIAGEFEREVAYQSLTQFLGNPEHTLFDAVFAGNDDAAIGAIKALQENGYRIPEDIAVVGFDDLRLSGFLTPPLTTVRAPTEEVGRIATEQLFSLIDDQHLSGMSVLPTEIIIRQSCGCHI
jgi:LacI family transcriptional regulator, galactose operon repressor